MQCPCKLEEGQFVNCNGLSWLLNSFISLERLQIKKRFVCFLKQTNKPPTYNTGKLF